MSANVANEKRGTLAVLSMIFGIAGIAIAWAPIVNFLGFLLSIAAIVLGAIEIKKINQGMSNTKGKGMALAGIILGAAAIVLGIVFTVIFGLALGGVLGYFGNWGYWK